MAKIINNNIYMLKYILKFCPSHFFIVIFTAILGCSTSVVNILCMRQFVNTISGTDGLSTLHTTFIFFCYWNILVILLNLVIQQLIIPINTQKIHQKMQHEIFKKTLELDLAHYENSDFYDKYNMALQQSDTRALAVLNSLSVLISSLLGISTLTVLVSSIEPLILLIVVFNVAISFLVSLLSTKIQHRFFKERIHPQRENGYVQRIFYIRDFAQELRLFTSLPKILTNKFDESFSSLQSLTKLYGKKGVKLWSINSISNVLSNALIIFYLAYKAINRKLSIGDFTAGSSSSQQLTSQILQLLNVFPQLYEHSMYIESFRDFMNLTPAVQCGSIAISQGSRIDIEMHNLSFRYPQCETVTLRNISLQIKAGEKVAFVGANGAGKSTLIKLLSRLYEPTNGQLLISGKDISLYDTTAYRSAVSVVFQNFQTYAFTIAENILMRPIENSSDEKTVVDSLKAVGLYQKIQNFPNGIYSVLSREFSNTGVTLSGGEIQKLAIARVYAQNSSIIILDEPTSGLDPFSEKALLTQLLNDTDGKTLILISHRLSNLVDVDKIYFIDGGQLIESGSHSELMHANGAYAEMFRLQAQDYLKGD